MDLIRQFQSFAWCKPDWCFPSMSKETNELLKRCSELLQAEVTEDVDEIIARSKAFPIPFPVETVRLEKLKVRRPIEKLRKNIVSTYPLIHERVLLLMTHFLIYKREFGTGIEKEFYREMGVPELIDRILKKRAVAFMGQKDSYMLLSGEEGEDGWEAIGTAQQRPPLLLSECLSYDEMKLSSMVLVSGPTECINEGLRNNAGVVSEEEAEKDAIIIGSTECINEGLRNNAGVVSEEEAEKDAIIIGAIGARFERPNRMEYEDTLITEDQNCLENGYGEEVTPTTCLNVLKTTYVRNNQSAKHMWRQMWSEFYQVHSYTYEELTSYVNIEDKSEQQRYTDRYVKLKSLDAIFDNEVFYKRISILAETVLLEANERAREAGKDAFVNVIGCGLGVWKISPHQSDVYVLTFLERVRHLLRKDMLQHVSDVNFAYITTSASIQALFANPANEAAEQKTIFFESKRHPRGGITVSKWNREPSSRLQGEHSGKLLVMTYPWDGNAHPGNEFWFGSLSGSGDPAAACSTQVAELHNAHINAAVVASRTHLAAPSAGGLKTMQEYCRLNT